MQKVAKNLTRYTVYVIMFIHIIRVFVMFISLLFLDLLLLLSHLLSNILVFSTQLHKLCNIFDSHHVSMKDLISRTQFIGYSYVIFPPQWSPGPSPGPRGYSFFFSQTKFDHKAALSVPTVRPNMQFSLPILRTRCVIFPTHFQN